MKILLKLLSHLSLLLLTNVSLATNNLPTQSPLPNTVHLRTICGIQQNCATTMQEVTDWLWSIRNPSDNSRVTVLIGAGVFDRFLCPAATLPNGYVTLLGSGRDATILSGTAPEIYVYGCEKLAFQDLSVKSNNFYAVRWEDGGSSTWTNVDINNVNGEAWLESCSPGSQQLHYWFNSRLTGHSGFSGAVYPAQCSENWFYGVEITSDYLGIFNTPSIGLAVTGNASARLFGSVIRSRLAAGTKGETNTPTVMVGVNVAQDGAFHMHGGMISVEAGNSTQSYDVFGLRVVENGSAHTPGTAFNLRAAGSGTAGRLIGDGKFESPFQWPQSVTPPSVVSKTGADTFVETDCDNSGNCDTGIAPFHPHVMVYDSSCTTAGSWFDSTRGKCRGEP